MIYFDSHFHFDPEDDLNEVLTRMQTAFAAAGGTPEDELRVAAMGGGWQESLAAQRFARAYPNGIFSAGIHPGAAERHAYASFSYVPAARILGRFVITSSCVSKIPWKDNESLLL